MQTCKTCKTEKAVALFENTPSGRPRAECKACRNAGRSSKVAARTAKPPDEATKPRACSICGRGPPEVDFQWRTDTLVCSWRKECYACIHANGYSDSYRDRERARDGDAFQRRNAEHQATFRAKNATGFD
jgi:hypothetical protein